MHFLYTSVFYYDSIKTIDSSFNYGQNILTHMFVQNNYTLKLDQKNRIFLKFKAVVNATHFIKGRLKVKAFVIKRYLNNLN